MISQDSLCSLQARRNGVPLIGTAGHYGGYLLMELRAPWKPKLFGSTFLDKAVGALLEEASRTKGDDLRFQALLPDPVYSDRGTTAVMHYGLGASGLLARRAWVVPCDDLVAFMQWLLFPERLGVEELAEREARFDAFVDPRSVHREILVCNHASRDDCCGRFGPPIYQELRDRYADEDRGLRVWRTSHLGGHRMAPTLLDLPSARYFGHVDAAVLAALVLGEEAGEAALGGLLNCYRGLGMLPKPAQLVEKELLAAEGWSWLDHTIRAAVEEGGGGVWKVAIEARTENPAGVGRGGPQGPSERSWNAEVESCPDRVVVSPDSCGKEATATIPLVVRSLSSA